MIRAVGLISGTSMDGIDAAAVEIHEGSPLRVEPRASLSRPYPPVIRECLATLCRPGGGLAIDACRATMVLG
ncbi:MAG: anhydro-N-acetylmuramic acid kinase, partial [Chloroflexota bacterium]